MIETTAYALAATFGFLASSNDVQDEIFEHIISIIGYDRVPVGASDKPCLKFHQNINIFFFFRILTIMQSFIKF